MAASAGCPESFFSNVIRVNILSAQADHFIEGAPDGICRFPRDPGCLLRQNGRKVKNCLPFQIMSENEQTSERIYSNEKLNNAI
jgi:hypothetical protein